MATKIVGNIPYYITGKLLRIVSELEHKPERTVLLIQKEVASDLHRTARDEPTRGERTILGGRGDHRTGAAQDFSPAPDVDSAVMVLSTKHAVNAMPSIDPTLYCRAVRAIFAQPRKTLLNNLSVMVGGVSKKNRAIALLKKIGLAPGARPQDLAIDQIISLAGAIEDL